jgi:LAO/AO transport system kinase
MEAADLILVTKADGELRSAAERTRADYAGALRLLRRRPQDPEGFPAALCVSALEEQGVTAAWAAIERLADWRRGQGHLAAARAAQAARAFEAEVREGLMAAALARPGLRAALEAGAREVAAGRASPEAAAAAVLAALAPP